MRMLDIILKKRDGGHLSNEEISFFIKGYVDGSIPDYQVSALAMAIYYKGMEKDEIINLTRNMRDSGDVIDLSAIPGIKVDKHSTGGVGDKTSLALVPVLAACGVKVAKMSGRGLGHTGGTLDKLESIPGLTISLNKEDFVDQVNKIGLAIIGQTASLVPADKKLYALRDVTGTVDSIPLIASSIMSKKLASGTNAILLDVKYGKGAFMKTIKDADLLAKTMCEIGNGVGVDTRAMISDMNQPLGNAVGNANEVIEAIDTLKGKGPKDFTELILFAASVMLVQAHIVSSKEEGLKLAQDAINSGKALNKLREMVIAQHGDPSYIDNPELFFKNKTIATYNVEASKSGYIKELDSLKIGISASKLGAGRERLEDGVDHLAGINIIKKIGDYVEKGDVLAYALTNKADVSEVLKEIEEAYIYSDEKVEYNEKVCDHLVE